MKKKKKKNPKLLYWNWLEFSHLQRRPENMRIGCRTGLYVEQQVVENSWDWLIRLCLNQCAQSLAIYNARSSKKLSETFEGLSNVVPSGWCPRVERPDRIWTLVYLVHLIVSHLPYCCVSSSTRFIARALLLRRSDRDSTSPPPSVIDDRFSLAKSQILRFWIIQNAIGSLGCNTRQFVIR